MTLLSDQQWQHGGRAPQRDVVSDDRGAILVMGIFMCCCMVGMLWYLAGIGDAILYRERMREASDAVAFSAAVLHARGMNLIVLLNLIMAIILAIRVLLKVLQIIFAVLVVVFGILCAIPFTSAAGCALLEVAEQGLEFVSDVLEETHDAINNAIKALHIVQKVVARLVPPGALLGSYQVGTRYETLVKQAAGGGLGTTVDGLPVDDDTPDKLCNMAGQAAAHYVIKIVSLGGASEKVESLFGDIVEAGQAYFCEIGSGSDSAPDLSQFKDDFGDTEDGDCAAKKDRWIAARDKEQDEYNDMCAQYSTVCPEENRPEDTSTLTSEERAQIAELDEKQGVIDDANEAIGGFDEEACKQEMEHGAEEKLNEMQNQDSQSTSSEDSEDMVPMKLLDDWNNGCTDAQILGVSYGDTSFLKYAPKLVKIGSWETEVEVSVPVTGKFDLSQAEFFYDCDQKWDSGACKNGDPMWHFRWRARLRRYNAPFGDNDNLQTVVGAAIGSEAYIQAVEAFDVDTLNHRNIQLYPDLIEAGDPDDILVH